jgi:predicted nucleic acid-binding protein
LNFYVDTSVLVAYYCPEPLSNKAEKFLTSQWQPAISALTELELFSAVSRKVRERGISERDAKRVLATFVSHTDNKFYTYIPVQQHHYRLARDWIYLFKWGLKSLDALHLAIASSEGLTILSADRNLIKSAEAMGLTAISL